MVWVTLGVNKKNISKFSLSYYSLIPQIIIINLITALIGFIFIVLINIFLIKNNNNIQIKVDQINEQINDITNYLKKNAIFKIPLFNEESGEIMFSSKPQLDPYASQLYVENKYLDQPNEIKIYNSDPVNLIKYVDNKDLYVASEVMEMKIDEVNKRSNFFHQYKTFYLNKFNKIQQYFDIKKMKEITEPDKNDIYLIKEIIKKQTRISKVFSYEDDSLSFNVLNPLTKDKEIYGVVLVRGFLTQENNQAVLISFNLFNLYLIIIFITFFLSIIFTRSIIRPIKILSSLVKIEQDKLNPSDNILAYPIRNDEIGSLSDDIKNMLKALKLRINELEKFASDVSHELKNPLSSLKTSNELLAGDKIKSEDKKLLFNNIIKDLDRMNGLISSISEYTRTQVEMEKQKFDEFELIEFINDLKLLFAQNNKKIKILFDTNDSEIIIQANIDKLAQVFINLIENAISFSPQQSNILIQQVRKDDRVIIYIADQGCGITEKSKDKIFERFYTDRLDKNYYHVGLGLSISKKIIENFNGSLDLCDKLIEGYNGACFKLELPIKD